MKNAILSLVAAVFAVSVSNVVLADNHEGGMEPATTTEAPHAQEVAKKAKKAKMEKKAKKEHKEETHGTDAQHH